MSADSPTVSNLTLSSPDGVALEAQLCAATSPVAAMVVAHPHPQFGGDMHSNVVAALWRAAPPLGVSVLRFNFRGVGASTGQSSGGPDERRDMQAALDALHGAAPGVPLVIAGYSFGAEIALASDHPQAVAWFCVAPVFRMFPPEALATAGRDPRPKRLVIAEHDQYAPPVAARESTRGWANTTIDIASMSDHFFAAGTRQVAESFASLMTQL